MYLNEKSWVEQQEDPYVIDCKIKKFLDIYSVIKRNFPQKEVYVPANCEKLYLKSTEYPLEKWMATADREYLRLFLSFWGKRVTYVSEDEFEFSLDGEVLQGATEAYLNNSFMLSIGLNRKWEQEIITGKLNSVYENEQSVCVTNVFQKEQLQREPLSVLLEKEAIINIMSYDELWTRRKEIFPHLHFCPSVEENLKKLESFYLKQIVKKLTELEQYCSIYGRERFDASLLSKTTPESESTMNQYSKEHTFIDDRGQSYLASWHMRFTGIPGRIFFIPNYEEDSILVCYIGKKLKNVLYST